GWLAFGAMIRTAWPREADPGRNPTATALSEEGFDDADPGRIAERFARHLMAATDLWQDAGFASIAAQYLARLEAVHDVRREIAEKWDLVICARAKTVETRSPAAGVGYPPLPRPG